MKIKTPIYIILSAILLTGCNNYLEEVSITATNALVPNKEIIATTTPTQTKTPYATSIYEPTIKAFESLIKNVCPTTTPTSRQEIGAKSISDNEILREFAGTYSQSDGFSSYKLVLNCDGSFYEITFPDFGGPFIGQGNVEVQNGTLLLKITNWSEPHTITYIPLRWGQRKYLIYANTGIERFCESLISEYGKEPRNKEWIIGLFYLRRGDDILEVIGLPVLPNGTEICK